MFLKLHSCYDLIPLSAKLIIFDVTLNVAKAFYALVYNNVRVAILWDSDKQQYAGMLTITDFIRILTHYYKSSDVPMTELEEHQIKTWREQLVEYTKPLVWIRPERSLYDAVRILLEKKVHRLPVFDAESGNALHILTHKRILKYLHLHMSQLPKPDFMNKTLEELSSLGTRGDITCVKEQTSLIKTMQLFIDKRVSAIPVVNEQNCLVDIYAKFDVINLAATRTYQNLDITVYQALNYRRQHFSGVATCNLSHTFQQIMDQIVNAGVHRLVLVDHQQHVLGIVSLSDILNFLIDSSCS
ncbi:hypothetical protein Ciccas_009273 [Cichlidogyrus casuarinus]|uniref:CBS domain-containing protein n=1 Tax=Cichlidogyrus casuarinus TaxID=1844966 RepID=A0ABD2Q1X9_9PLAT